MIAIVKASKVVPQFGLIFLFSVIKFKELTSVVRFFPFGSLMVSVKVGVSVVTSTIAKSKQSKFCTLCIPLPLQSID